MTRACDVTSAAREATSAETAPTQSTDTSGLQVPGTGAAPEVGMGAMVVTEAGAGPLGTEDTEAGLPGTEDIEAGQEGDTDTASFS